MRSAFATLLSQKLGIPGGAALDVFLDGLGQQAFLKVRQLCVEM